MHNLGISLRNPQRYPQASAVLPGILGEAQLAMVRYGADPAIVTGNICAVASLLGQGLVDVAWPNGQVIPAGCSGIVVAPSGAGKSMISSLVLGPVYRALEPHRLAAEHAMAEAEAQLAALDPTRRGGKTKKGPRVSIPNLLVEDVSESGLVYQLASWPVAGLFSDELGQFTDLMKKQASKLAKLTDGSVYSRSRGISNRIDLRKHRFMLFLQGQPQVFASQQNFLGAKGGGIGLVNRFLLFRSRATHDTACNFGITLPENIRSTYSERVTQMVDLIVTAVKEGQDRPILHLSPEAAIRLESAQHMVKYNLGMDFKLLYMSEYANRHAERIIRLAAALHAFVFGQSGEISGETLAAAEAVGRVALADYQELAYIPPKLTKAENNARRAASALLNYFPWHHQPEVIDLSYLMSNALNFGMSRSQLDGALQFLAREGFVRTQGHGRRKMLGVHLPALRDWYWAQTSSAAPSMIGYFGGTI